MEDRVEEERLQEALKAYGWLLGWCSEHAPKALREMPTDLYRATNFLSLATTREES